MTNSFPTAINLTTFVAAAETRKTRYDEIYRKNCDRIYSLAFWMTDNELTAEQLSANTFLRAFACVERPESEQIDRAFLTEVRELMPIGALSLNETVASPGAVYGNVKRIHLERALVQLPATEKLIFLLHDVERQTHEQITRLLGLTTDESKSALHQARMQIRNLISKM